MVIGRRSVRQYHILGRMWMGHSCSHSEVEEMDLRQMKSGVVGVFGFILVL